LPLPGIDAEVVDKHGNVCPPDVGGYLVVRRPWPSIFRTIWGDRERYAKGYFSEISVGGRPYYFAGDGARRDKDGYFWVMGRVDDVINVAGHRLGTAEIESALVGHVSVAEAACVGRPDEIKGQGIVAFVTLRAGHHHGPELKAVLIEHVTKEIGAIARPDEIRFTDALPKTRSGKIMRRLLKEIAAGGQVRGDVTTLEDLAVLERLSTSDEE
jgi:acetyl-CoA synthetase